MVEAADEMAPPETPQASRRARPSGTRRAGETIADEPEVPRERRPGADLSKVPRRRPWDRPDEQQRAQALPAPPLLKSLSTWLMVGGIACIAVFFAIQPKTHLTPTGSTSSGSGSSQNAGGSGQGTGSGSGTSGGQPTLPAPNAHYTTAWKPTVITQRINEPFDLGPTPPQQENANAGLEISDADCQSQTQALCTSNGGSVVPWTRAPTPTFPDCVKALQAGSATAIPIDKPGTWACAQTPEGRIARLQSKGVATNTPTLITYRFVVTVWNPAK